VSTTLHSYGSSYYFVKNKSKVRKKLQIEFQLNEIRTDLNILKKAIWYANGELDIYKTRNLNACFYLGSIYGRISKINTRLALYVTNEVSFDKSPKYPKIISTRKLLS